MKTSREVIIVANAAWGPLLSGGDNIFIECARRWAAAGHAVKICVWEEGADMCRRQGLSGVELVLWPAGTFRRWGFLAHYAARVVIGAYRSLRMPLAKDGVIYSASDFWPDLLPAFILKMRRARATWVAGFYLFAPRPWDKASPYKGAHFFKGLAYWLTQCPAFWLVRYFADRVFITSAPDAKRFAGPHLPQERVVIVRGGVDTAPSEAYLASGHPTQPVLKKYDACFVGRFHEQKGVLELADIWREVTRKKPDAKLVMIGDGPLAAALMGRIAEYRLENNIELVGFKNGEDKFAIFKQSRLVVHPATYDSGGMAAAEAMAWGLPGVSFDLESLQTYYPKGMLKTPCYDVAAFAANILALLSDSALYEKVSADAVELVRSQWGWDGRVASISKTIFDE